MKPIILALLIFAFVKSADASEASFAEQVKKLFAGRGTKAAISFYGPDGAELLNVHGDQLMAPASVAKTISTACSLDALGPQFQFSTDFGMTGKLKEDTLEGDLVIQGGGDPSLIIEDLHEIIDKLRFVNGIRKITGNLVIDARYFGKKSLSFSDGFEGDDGRSFTADLTPLIFNQNSFSVWVTADHRSTSGTRAAILPAGVLDLTLTNTAKVGGSTDVNISYDPVKQHVTVHGTMAKDAEPKGIYRSVDDPYGYELKLFKRLWKESGGEWPNPRVVVSTTAVKSTLLYRNSSRPLSKILMDVNKFSLNLGAEMIFLAAGAEKFGPPASYEKSLKLLSECLAQAKIPPGSVLLTNGSGLSREARVKVSALSQFMSKYAKSDYAPEYLSSFGLAGLDGTSKSRLKEFAGRARLKTGSLKDTRAIAGYLTSRDHQLYSFAMIQNGVDPNGAKSLEDSVIGLFLKEH